jgi:hypothetical protein
MKESKNVDVSRLNEVLHEIFTNEKRMEYLVIGSNERTMKSLEKIGMLLAVGFNDAMYLRILALKVFSTTPLCFSCVNYPIVSKRII